MKIDQEEKSQQEEVSHLPGPVGTLIMVVGPPGSGKQTQGMQIKRNNPDNYE